MSESEFMKSSNNRRSDQRCHFDTVNPGPSLDDVPGLDRRAYETFLVGLGSLSGVTPTVARTSGVGLGEAVPVRTPGELEGVLLLREWVSPSKSSRMLVFLAVDGLLRSFSVWRGSRSYKDVVSAPLGSFVACSFVRSGAGRVVCESVSPDADRGVLS